MAKSSDFSGEPGSLEFKWKSLDFKNLGYVEVFVFLFARVRVCVCVSNTVKPKENIFASCSLPVGCKFVISDLVQLPHFTDQDAKEKSDICIYLVSGSVRGLKPGLLIFNLFLFPFYHAAP